jgi:hypothetical protein
MGEQKKKSIPIILKNYTKTKCVCVYVGREEMKQTTYLISITKGEAILVTSRGGPQGGEVKAPKFFR